MTPEERQALRETHVKWAGIKDDGELTWFCRKCNFVEFPCDAIKVLDATEPVSKRVPNQCDNEHPQMSASASKSKKSSDPCNDDTHEPDESVFYADIGWNYCPRCGVKL